MSAFISRHVIQAKMVKWRLEYPLAISCLISTTRKITVSHLKMNFAVKQLNLDNQTQATQKTEQDNLVALFDEQTHNKASDRIVL